MGYTLLKDFSAAGLSNSTAVGTSADSTVIASDVVDVPGSLWGIKSGALTNQTQLSGSQNPSAANPPLNGLYFTETEGTVDGKVVVYVNKTEAAASDQYDAGALARYTSEGGGQGYAAFTYSNGTSLFLWSALGGAVTQNVDGVTISPALPDPTNYALEFVVAGSVLTVNLYDMTGGTVGTLPSTPVFTYSYTDTTANASALDTGGYWGADAFDGAHIARVQAYTAATLGPPTVTGVSVSPADPITSTATVQFSATVNGTNGPSQGVTWATSAGSISTGGLFTPPAQTSSEQTVTVTATSTEDTTKSGTATVTIPQTGGAVITSGAASLTFAGKTKAILAGTASSGGIGTLSYQWHLSTAEGFTPSSGTAVSGQTSASAASLSGLTPGAQYYAKFVTTDGAGDTATSNEVALTTLAASAIIVGFLGDSITVGTGSGGPVAKAATYDPSSDGNNAVQWCNHYLTQAGQANACVNGGVTGNGAVSFAYNWSSTLENFVAHEVNVVSVMLGTDDARGDKFITQGLAYDGSATVGLGVLPYPPESGSPFLANYPSDTFSSRLPATPPFVDNYTDSRFFFYNALLNVFNGLFNAGPDGGDSGLASGATGIGTIVVHYPPYIQEGETAGNSSLFWDTTSADAYPAKTTPPFYANSLLEAYQGVITNTTGSTSTPAIVNGGTVLLGDTTFWALTEGSSSYQGDGVHPTQYGHQLLGQAWADAILAALAPASVTVKIDCGAGGAGDYVADTDYSGGGEYAAPDLPDITGLTNPAPAVVYQTSRYDDFTYTLPGFAPGAACTLRLHFAEGYFTSAGDRLFNVAVNGTTVLSDYDIFAAAGAKDKGVIESFSVNADSAGNVTVVFTNVTNNAQVNAIDCTSGTPPPPPTSYQINAGGGAAGAFSPDEDYSGGSTYSTGAAIDLTGVTAPAPEAAYQTERFGNFTYALTGLTAGADYTVRLHFAEIYWTAAGDRLFNVAVNGTTVLSDYDIFATAGAENKAIVETFSTTADSSGDVTIVFTTVQDNAKVSAIECVPA